MAVGIGRGPRRSSHAACSALGPCTRCPCDNLQTSPMNGASVLTPEYYATLAQRTLFASGLVGMVPRAALPSLGRSAAGSLGPPTGSTKVAGCTRALARAAVRLSWSSSKRVWGATSMLTGRRSQLAAASSPAGAAAPPASAPPTAVLAAGAVWGAAQASLRRVVRLSVLAAARPVVRAVRALAPLRARDTRLHVAVATLEPAVQGVCMHSPSRPTSRRSAWAAGQAACTATMPGVHATSPTSNRVELP